MYFKRIFRYVENTEEISQSHSAVTHIKDFPETMEMNKFMSRAIHSRTGRHILMPWNP